MKKKIGGGVFLLVVFLALGGVSCKKGASDDPVWIRVNGQEVHKSEIEKEINRYRIQLAQQFGDQIPPEEKEKIESMMKRESMLNAVRRCALDQAADKEGITADPAKVEEELKKIKGQFPDETAFQNKLAELSLTEQNLKEDIARKFRYDELFKRKVVIPEPSEEEINQMYEQAKPRLKKPPQVKGTQVLITLVPNAPEEEKKKKRAAAEAALKRIQGGEDIGKVATEVSEAPSKANAGKETWTKGQIPTELENALFSMKVGEVSSIIETTVGYYIVKVEEIIPEGIVPLSEIRDNIIQVIKDNKRGEAIQKYIEDLIKSANVEYLEPLPPEIMPEPPPPAPTAGGTAAEETPPAAGATTPTTPAPGATAVPSSTPAEPGKPEPPPAETKPSAPSPEKAEPKTPTKEPAKSPEPAKPTPPPEKAPAPSAQPAAPTPPSEGKEPSPPANPPGGKEEKPAPPPGK